MATIPLTRRGAEKLREELTRLRTQNQVLQDQLLAIWETRPRTMVFITHSIEEAVAMGDRVVVLSPRPARVRMVIPVDIPRPRTVAGVVAHPSFIELRDLCWELLRDVEAA